VSELVNIGELANYLRELGQVGELVCPITAISLERWNYSH